MVLASGMLLAQAPPSQNVLGVVTKVDAAASKLTLKTDAGAEVTVGFQPKTIFQKVAPGETDLKNANAIHVEEIEIGDRVIAVATPAADQSLMARRVVVMSKADIANKQSGEMADWQKRGVIGKVTAVGGDHVTINVRGRDGVSKPLEIAPAKDAVIRRYSAESTKFQDAKPSTMAEIHVGDEIRARGDKSADGGKMEADEVVSGSFKEIAATILSIDAAEGIVRVNDLATKKPMIIKITADSKVRKIPLQMAQALAQQNRPPEDRDAAPAGRGGGPAGPGGDGRGRGGRGAGDLAQIVDRAQPIKLTDLKNGDALILLGTAGANDQLAVITMLAGVEPILTKPGTREMALGGWSLGGGMGEP